MSYQYEVQLSATPEGVLAALTTSEGIAGWWAKSNLIRQENSNELLSVDFGRVKKLMRVQRTISSLGLTWDVLECSLREWPGTRITFEITPTSACSCLLKLEHIGLVPQSSLATHLHRIKLSWVHQHKGNTARGITMLAWQIYISTEKNINEDASIDASFASWATGLGGDQWIKDLVKANKAQILKESCGYPNYYTAKAKYIIPLIIKDLPQYNGFFVIGEDYVLNGKKNWDIKLEKTKLATITPNKLLYIETWDRAIVQSGYSQPLVNGIQGLAL